MATCKVKELKTLENIAIELVEFKMSSNTLVTAFKDPFKSANFACNVIIHQQNTKLATIRTQNVTTETNERSITQLGIGGTNFFKAMQKTLPYSTKHANPLYWFDFLLSWTLTPLRKGLILVGLFLNIPSNHFWEKASKALFEKTNPFGKTNPYDLFTLRQIFNLPGKEIGSRIWGATKYFLAWCVLGAIPCWFAQVFHLAANILSYATRLVSGITELLGSITSPLWVGISHAYHNIVRDGIEPLHFSDFSPWYAFKEIFWNILFLVPAATIVLMSAIPGVGLVAAPALVPLMSGFNVALQGFILGALYAPVAQIVTGLMSEVRNKGLGVLQRISAYCCPSPVIGASAAPTTGDGNDGGATPPQPQRSNSTDSTSAYADVPNGEHVPDSHFVPLDDDAAKRAAAKSVSAGGGVGYTHGAGSGAFVATDKRLRPSGSVSHSVPPPPQYGATADGVDAVTRDRGTTASSVYPQPGSVGSGGSYNG